LLDLHVAESLSQFVVSQSKECDKTIVDDFIVTKILARNMKLANSRSMEMLEGKFKFHLEVSFL
jgi:hypothetical protein